MKVAIVALRYLEPDWVHTQAAIQACNASVHYVDRNPDGVGNMAEAYNRGFREVYESPLRPEYVWFVSNVTFKPDMLWQLVTAMDANPGYAAIHPAFNSDHIFCRPRFDPCGYYRPDAVLPIPFAEFTAPIVRAHTFANFPLDESMPYWGHDLDWGARLWGAGHRIGVLQSDRPLIEHTYIRHSCAAARPHPVTRTRHALRRATNASTRHRLTQKYGPHYKDLIFPQSEPEIEKWRQRSIAK